MVPFSEYVDEELSPIIINDLSQLQNDVSSFNKKFQKFEINKIISYFTEYFRDKYKELMNNSCINIKSLNNLNDLNRNYFLKMIYVKGIISYEEKGKVFNLEEMKNALVTLGLFENEKELFDMYNEELKIRATHSQKLGG